MKQVAQLEEDAKIRDLTIKDLNDKMVERTKAASFFNQEVGLGRWMGCFDGWDERNGLRELNGLIKRREGRKGKGREGKGREGKGREGKGREGKGREGKGREGSIYVVFICIYRICRIQRNWRNLRNFYKRKKITSKKWRGIKQKRVENLKQKWRC